MKTLRVHFLKTSDGPEGVRQAGTIHDLPEAEAKRFIETGAAVEAGPEDNQEKPPETASLQTTVSNSFSDAEWDEGIEVEDWVESRDRDEYRTFTATMGPLLAVSGDDYDEGKGKLHLASLSNLREILRTDYRERMIGLGSPPKSIFDNPQEIPAERINEVINLINFSPIRPSHVYFRGEGFDVRVYRPDRFLDPSRSEPVRSTGAAAGADESTLTHNLGRPRPSGDKKPGPPRERGRPSRKEEIKPAFERLRDQNKLTNVKKLIEVYPLVRAEICKAARAIDETELEDETEFGDVIAGLGDEVIRRKITELFKNYIRDRKSANKL